MERFDRGEQFFDRPLALLWHEALGTAGSERLTKFRSIGDAALYMTGFFSDSIERRAVGVDYYIALGGHAYRHAASTLSGRRRGGDAGLFRELAEKFERFVDVFGEVSESASLASNQGVLRLYERWLRTGSDWIRRKLVARGVVPLRPEAAGTDPVGPGRVVH